MDVTLLRNNGYFLDRRRMYQNNRNEFHKQSKKQLKKYCRFELGRFSHIISTQTPKGYSKENLKYQNERVLRRENESKIIKLV